VKKKKYVRNLKERRFMQAYQNHTNLEFIDDTSVPFIERARQQLRWYETHSTDTIQRLGRHLAEFEGVAA
jgi:hypothetical protein